MSVHIAWSVHILSLNYISFDLSLSKSSERHREHTYPALKKKLGDTFQLDIEEGSFTSSEIVVMLGQNGTGKTTFIRMLVRP